MGCKRRSEQPLHIECLASHAAEKPAIAMVTKAQTSLGSWKMRDHKKRDPSPPSHLASSTEGPDLYVRLSGQSMSIQAALEQIKRL